MADWPRTIEPQESTGLMLPGPLVSLGQGGKDQRRATVQLGWSWTERYPPFKASAQVGRAFVAALLHYWRSGETFQIQHYDYRAHLGLGAGSPQVPTASQTGGTLETNNWGGSSPVLRAGDLFRIVGVPGVRMMRQDATPSNNPQMALYPSPPIFAGASPALNAAITYGAALKFDCYLAALTMPTAGPDGYLVGVQCTFKEAL